MTPSHILDQLAVLGVGLPVCRSTDDPCTVLAADGRDIFTVDVNGERDDEEANDIAGLLIDLINAADDRRPAGLATRLGLAIDAAGADPHGGKVLLDRPTALAVLDRLTVSHRPCEARHG